MSSSVVGGGKPLVSGVREGAEAEEHEWCFRILESLDLAIVVVRKNVSIVMANRSARQSSLWQEHVTAASGEDIGTIDKRASELLSTISPSGQTQIDMPAPDGTQRWKGSAWFIDDELLVLAVRQERGGRTPLGRLCDELSLEPQEARLALRVQAGDSNPDIARRYDISLSAVRSRLWMLTRKLSVSNRAALAALVARVLAGSDDN